MADDRPDSINIRSGSPPSPRRTRCNFCGRTSDVTGSMVEGPGDVYICGDCVEIAYGIILQDRGRKRIWPDANHPARGRNRPN